MNYPGFSASFLVSFGKLKEHLEIDIGFGDVVGQVQLPVKLMRGLGRAIFEDEISLFVYPAESILAEKLQTVVFRADKNSRMKDYYDIFRLLNSSVLSKEKVTSAIGVTFEHRQTNIGLLPLRFSEAEFDQLQKYWSAFHRGLRSKEDIPKQICAVVDFINRKRHVGSRVAADSSTETRLDLESGFSGAFPVPGEQVREVGFGI
jgi:hypothetical protein